MVSLSGSDPAGIWCQDADQSMTAYQQASGWASAAKSLSRRRATCSGMKGKS